MTPEVYGLIYGWIADKLEEAGYSVDRKDKRRKPSGPSNTRPSGLDWSKRHPTSLFYLPCQAKNSDDSFFHEHIEGRYPLRPSTWIDNSAVPLQPTLESFDPLDNETLEVDWEAVVSAVQVWRGSQMSPAMVTICFLCLRAPSNLQE
jgi:hypothetical protein